MRRRFIDPVKGGGRACTAALACLAAWTALVAAGGAAASGFQINPVVLEVLGGRQNTSVRIRNSEAAPVSVRIRLFRWTQRTGEDVYDETDAIIASPPIVTIPAGASQIVRIGPRTGQLSGAYRVVVEEILPPAPRKGEVRIALRLNLPLYVTPSEDARAALHWSGWRDAAGNLVLEARNDGDRHDAVVAIGAVDAARRDVPLSSRLGAVLPGGSRRWTLGKHPEFAVGAPLQLTVRSSDGTIARPQVTLRQR